MLLPCSRVQVLFPQEKIYLEHQGPPPLLLDEHGNGVYLAVAGQDGRRHTEKIARVR